MLTILLKFNEKVLKTIETDKEVISIGRNAQNDIHIDNLSVSKQHAQIVRQKNVYLVEDLKSTNGTYLNEKPVTKAKINDQDVLTIGKHTLELYFNQKVSRNGSHAANDTMLLTTEKHKQMLKKQKSAKN